MRTQPHIFVQLFQCSDAGLVRSKNKIAESFAKEKQHEQSKVRGEVQVGKNDENSKCPKNREWKNQMH